MKKFVAPELEVEKLMVEDVITTSACDEHIETCDSEVQGCPNDLGL